MPSKALRYCSFPGCPERVEKGRCKAHQQQGKRDWDQHRGNADQRGYDAGWRKLRQVFLAMNPMCADCSASGRIALATDVHHVAKVQDAPHLRLDPSNLMALCHECHSRRTARGE